MMEFALHLGARIIVGGLGGLLGIGGGVILMPFLRFIVGLSPAFAAGTCILAVFFTTLGGSFCHHRLGHVHMKSLYPLILAGAISTVVFSLAFLFFTTRERWIDLGVGMVFAFISLRMIMESLPNFRHGNMKIPTSNAILTLVSERFREILQSKDLLNTVVRVTAHPLSPEEAIGKPSRKDYPIIEGKERVIEAVVLGARGQAFTDSPENFTGTLQEVLRLPLNSNQNRAIFISVLNAVLRHLDIAEGTVHCKDDDPERCAEQIASTIANRWGKPRIGLIGLNPAIAQRLVETFGADQVSITDLNLDNINQMKFGVQLWDGRQNTERLIRQSDVIILTGTTLVNGTFDTILNHIQTMKKEYIIYGMTCSGICTLMGLPKICPYGRNH